MWQITSKFNAGGTSGAEYVITEERDSADDAKAHRRYTIADGQELSAEQDGTFSLLDTGEVLKAAAPSAVPTED